MYFWFELYIVLSSVTTRFQVNMSIDLEVRIL